MVRARSVATLLSCAPVHEACAQANLVEREIEASAARDVRLGVYTSIRTDCTSDPLLAIRLAGAPFHGVVTVKVKHSVDTIVVKHFGFTRPWATMVAVGQAQDQT